MRTKKIIMLLGVTLTMVLIAGGCKANSPKTEINKPAVETTAQDTTTDKGLESENSTDATVDTTQLTTDKAIDSKDTDTTSADTDAKKDIPMVKLPEGIAGMKAETEPNVALEVLIKEYMEIPDDSLATTQYYYNYVDLDGDGTNEIFVMVSGSYTSGSGGSSALIVSEKAGKYHVMQNFTLVNAPIIISDEKENGHSNIILPYFGNDKSQYSVLTYKDGEYTNVPDGKMIDNLDGVKGKAILANDLLQEATTGNITGISLGK